MQFAGEDFFAKAADDRVYFDGDRRVVSLSQTDS